MKRLILLLLAAILVGCAQQPNSSSAPTPDPATATGGDQRARIYTELAAGYFSRGQYAVALEDLRKALSADAAYAPAYNVQGLVNAELKEDAQAENAFRRALDLAPNYSEAHNNYGLFLCKRERAKEAMHHFESALANQLYASPDRALANAGACALKSGDMAAAENFFTRALKRAPKQPLALLGMADIRFRQSHLLAARSLLRFLGDVAEPSSQALWLALRVERGLGDRETEATFAAQLRRRYPESTQTQWLTSGQFDQIGSLI